MDSEIKFKVLDSFFINQFGIITELENVINGIPENGVIKSINSNLFWEVKSRLIENSSEKRFERENEIFIHVNKTDPTKDLSSVIKLREEKNIRSYKVIPIGHELKPSKDEDLVFHSTTFRKKIKIVEVYENYFLLEDNETNYKAVIPKRKVGRSKMAKIGDFVRHCEHQYHDLLDINDEFIYRET